MRPAAAALCWVSGLALGAVLLPFAMLWALAAFAWKWLVVRVTAS